MKTSNNLPLAGMIAALTVFCCSVGNAQITYSNTLAGPAVTLVYSNAFDQGSVNITNTLADYEAGILGGGNNTFWVDALGTNDTGYMGANGLDESLEPDSWELPFTPQSGHVYTLTASLTFNGSPGNWVGVGFAERIPTNAAVGYGRFSDGGSTPPDEGPEGYDWTILTESSGNVQAFGGGGGSASLISSNSFFTAGVGTETVRVVLNTTSTQWVIAVYVDGKQAGANYTYSANPPIGALGITQSTLTSIDEVQWNSLMLFANQLVLLEQPAASASLIAGSAYTNTVVAGGTPPFAYQWFNNGSAISGATNASLILNPVLSADASTNLYVVVTNVYGAVTSAPASLIVYSAPTLVSVSPTPYTNVMTLFGGTNIDGTSYLGSTPTFSVSVTGEMPLAYQWLTNGVAVGGATNGSFTFTNCQLSSPTNFSCVVTNNGGRVSNTWSVVYLPTPTAPFPQAVLSAEPAAFWRLNEQPDNNNGDDGTIANDYQSGNNGLYTNVVLDQTGYNPAEPGETSVFFGSYADDNSYAGSIEGVNFGVPAGSNGEFTVEAWADGAAADSGAPVVSMGTYGASDPFGLGADTSNQRNYQFYVRSASGTVYTADSTTPLNGNWVHLVGVCDEANGNLLLYIDGQLAASASIPTNSGVYQTDAPVAIGAGTDGTSGGYDIQFFGYIDDVAAYNYALSPIQVDGLYQSISGDTIAPYFVPVPETSAVITNTTITIPVTAYGTAPLGYYWTNLTTAAVIGSGATNTPAALDATLTLTDVTTNMAGEALELVVTNAYGSTNWLVTLSLPIPPPATISYTNSIFYTNAFNGSSSESLAGTAANEANFLVGGTNSVWVDALGTNDTGYMGANGLDESLEPDSWVLPFTPEPGYVYTLTATLTFDGSPGNWIGAGFAERVPTNSAVGYGRFSDGGTAPPDEGPEGYDWGILTESSGSAQAFAGPGGDNITSPGGGVDDVTSSTGTNTIQVILATTNAQWVSAVYINGTQVGTNYTYPAGNNPPIGAVGITQNALTADDIQWDSFALTAVAPVGVPPYLMAPLPPTSVLLTNTTITIPVTIFGSAPLGYYWVNTNTSAILASGATNNLSPLNATLTLTDVTTNLAGDVAELVVTNAYGTNVTMVVLGIAPTVPTQIFSYTSSILYSNAFNGSPLVSLARTQPTAINILVGTNSTWVDALGTNDSGSMLANGVDASLEPDSWVLPFTPESGYVYTLTASLTFDGSPGNWIGAGFAERVPTNSAVGYGRFSDGGSAPPDEGPEGYDWGILTESSGNVQAFAGPGGNNPLLTSANDFFTPGTGPNTIQVILATTNAQWTVAVYVDGVQAGTNYTYPAGDNPPIGALGITQNTLSTLDEVQWNSFTLTAVAPGGVPPYLLAPLPPTQVTNTTVTIPATAFGSGPLGYYWTLNNTVLASGVTNDTAPISANITVPSSLGGGQLELTVTNAYGTNITAITLVGLVNPNPTNIVATVTNNNLYLTWPTDHIGWQLQAQTNGLGLGISTNWVDYNPSTGTNQVVIPIDPTNGAVFYRLIYSP